MFKKQELIEDLRQDFHELHKKGRVALYLNAQPDVYHDKFDHPSITNNEREDGGSPLNKTENYQLHLIVSATLLPPAQYPIEQRLYETMFRYFFIGLDIEKCRINSFEFFDSQTSYNVKNKHNRPSYKATFFNDDIKHLSYEERLTTAYKKNNSLAFAVTQPSGNEDDLFGIQPPIKLRPINEILLKVNINSMVCLGSTATVVAANPAIILDLIYMQHQFFQYLGINFPIIIYNHRLHDISLNFIDIEPKTISANKGAELNVHYALIQMMKRYPDGIPSDGEYIGILNEKIGSTLSEKHPYSVHEFIKFMNYPIDGNQLPVIKSTEDLQQELLNKRYKFINQLETASTSLSQLLIPYDSNKDSIIQIHKKDRVGLAPFEQFLEVNQKNLHTFIMDNYFDHLNTTDLAEEYTDYFKKLTQAYNLQFRMNIYISLLNDQNSLLNYNKLTNDLAWFNFLLPTIKDIRDKLSSNNEDKYCGLM